MILASLGDPDPLYDPVANALGSISTVASNFSALAAVLAGFAFACLITLALTPGGKKGEVTAAVKAVPAMTAAFVGLVLISVNYAAIGGETVASPRLATVEVFAGVGFTTSGILLPYVILVLLSGVNSDDRRAPLELSVRFLKFCICFAGPLLMLLEYAAVHDAITLGKTYAQTGITPSDVISFAIIGLLIVNSVGAYFHWWGRMPLLRGLWRVAMSRPERTLWHLSRLAVVISVVSIAAVRFVWLTFEPTQAAPDGVLLASAGIFAVFAILVTWSAMTYDLAHDRQLSPHT